jgi:oxygen-dependent protoporphyrinogen oxidase
MTVDFAVVGGGLSGLATALSAKRDGKQVRLFEKNSRPGGKVKTLHEDGYVVELGPLGFLDREPGFAQFRQDLNLDLIPADVAVKKRFLLHQGHLCELPSGPLSLLSSPLLSWSGKLRLLAEPFISSSSKNSEELSAETVREFARRRLGVEASDRFFEPFVSGIFAGDPEKLSIAAAFPRLHQFEKDFGSIFRGALQERRRRKKRQAAGEAVESMQTLTCQTGMQAMVEAMVSALGDKYLGGTGVTSLHKEGGEWRLQDDTGRTHHAKKIVLALPGAAAEKLLLPLAPELAGLAKDIPSPPFAVVVAAWPREMVKHPCEGFGFLIPRSEGVRALGVQFAHSVFPSQTPPGKVQLRFLLGGALDPQVGELTKEELIEAAIQPLKSILGMTAPPEKVWVRQMQLGIPQYQMGFGKRKAQWQAVAQKLGSLRFIGDSFQGIGVPAAFQSNAGY